jgi:ABC-2 type transport system ATP-binding protein
LAEAGRLLEEVTSSPVRLDRSGRRASAPTDAGTADLAALIRSLEDAMIGVDEIGLRRPNLDEVFFALVGDGGEGGDGGDESGANRVPAVRQPEGSLR